MSLSVSGEEGDPHAVHAQVVPFVGSGVSLFEPTSLPSWYGFVDAVLAALAGAAGEEKPDMDSVPMYAVTEILSRRLGIKYLDVLGGLLNRPANESHKLLAENIITRKYPAVVTTNFDCVLEDLLASQGVSICNVFGVDSDVDQKALETQFEHAQGELRVIVCIGALACECLERMPTLIGQENVCVYIKLHGDARYPKTCIDTELQREKGLPAQQRNVLSILLRRFPLFFLGFSGGDLEHNIDYLRLRSEADAANLYWLLLPGVEEPRAFGDLRSALSRDGGSLHVVRGFLPGKVPKSSDDFLCFAKEWAESGIGPGWASLALGDIRRFQARAGDRAGGLERAIALVRAVPASEDLEFASRHRAMALGCVQALECLGHGGDLDKAWGLARKALMTAQELVPSAPLLFADAWVPFLVAGLVSAQKGDAAMASSLLGDSLLVSRMSGNKRAALALEESAALTQLQAKSKGKLARRGTSYEPEHVQDEDRITTFVLGLDSTASSHPSGLPNSVVFKAELFRAVLVSDQVVLSTAMLLDNKELIMNVLFDQDRTPQKALFKLLKPLLEEKYLERARPLSQARKDQVENARFIHSNVPQEYTERTQDVFLANKVAPMPVSYRELPSIYSRRVIAELEHSANLLDDVVRLPLLDYARAIAGNDQEHGLSRSDMYRWADLFPKKPTSGSQLWELMPEHAKRAFPSKEAFLAGRAKALQQPWISAQKAKLIADAAYITNLPCLFGFSMTVSGLHQEMLPVVSNAIEKEASKPCTILPEVSSSSIQAAVLARLSVQEVLALRDSPRGMRFRVCLRRFKTAPSPAAEKALLEASAEFAAFLGQRVVPPQKRQVPERLATSADSLLDDRALSDLKLLAATSLTPGLSAPPLPMYSFLELPFPGICPVRLTSPVDTRQRLDEGKSFHSQSRPEKVTIEQEQRKPATTNGWRRFICQK